MPKKLETIIQEHLDEAKNLCRDAVFSINNYAPKDIPTIIYILQNAVDEMEQVKKLEKIK